MTSCRSYGNSDLDKTYRILNFNLSLVQLKQSIFCQILEGGTVVGQGWKVSLLKNPIEPP